MKDGVQVITPNPKTSGGDRWNYLAAWAYAKKKEGSDEKAQAFVKKLLGNVPVLDTSARGSTVTFTERGIGDVLLAWENEAYLAVNELGPDKFEIVTPSQSILAAADDRGGRQGRRQEGHPRGRDRLSRLPLLAGRPGIAAKHYYRPRTEAVAETFKDKFAKLELFTIDQEFGGCRKPRRRTSPTVGIGSTRFTRNKPRQGSTDVYVPPRRVATLSTVRPSHVLARRTGRRRGRATGESPTGICPSSSYLQTNSKPSIQRANSGASFS